MAFTPLTFSKSWENPADFPTYEPDEAQVRADLQYLHNEVRDAFNGLISALNDKSAAANLPIAVDGLTAQTVQAAIEETLKEVQNAAAGLLVNGSITKEKLHASLLRRVYGGRVVVSWDTPGDQDNEAADYPVGQLWLRPALSVANLVKTYWSTDGCTASYQNPGWYFSADRTTRETVVSQHLTNAGQPGQRVLLHLDAAGHTGTMTSLNFYVNNTLVTIPADGWLEVQVSQSGSLDLELAARWPSAQTAGSFQVRDCTVVPVGALETAFPQCTPPRDWKTLLGEALPFRQLTRTRAVFMEVADGVWETLDYEILPVARGGTGLDAVTPGQLLYGGETALQVLEPPGEDGAVLRFSGGVPRWTGPEETVTDLGSPRTFQGSYTGSKQARTISLAAAPIALLIQPAGLEGTVLIQGQGIDLRDSCSRMDSSGRYPTYDVGVRLEGNALTMWLDASDTALNCGASAHLWNESGQVYHYVGLY